MAQTAPCVRFARMPASLAEGQTGLCRARVAEGGQVVDANYGRITSLALDPIEKKPLARFRPGSKVLSVGSYGCNLRCPFCQNASIACAGERDVPWREIAPAELVDAAASLAPEGNIGLAFTYNEPLVGLEFVRGTGAPRPRAWPGQRAGVQRLRERRPAARGGAAHRRREHRPEGLHPRASTTSSAATWQL